MCRLWTITLAWNKVNNNLTIASAWNKVNNNLTMCDVGMGANVIGSHEWILFTFHLVALFFRWVNGSTKLNYRNDMFIFPYQHLWCSCTKITICTWTLYTLLQRCSCGVEYFIPKTRIYCNFLTCSLTDLPDNNKS